jgi:hypothetical protein
MTSLIPAKKDLPLILFAIFFTLFGITICIMFKKCYPPRSNVVVEHFGFFSNLKKKAEEAAKKAAKKAYEDNKEKIRQAAKDKTNEILDMAAEKATSKAS